MCMLEHHITQLSWINTKITHILTVLSMYLKRTTSFDTWYISVLRTSPNIHGHINSFCSFCFSSRSLQCPNIVTTANHSTSWSRVNWNHELHPYLPIGWWSCSLDNDFFLEEYHKLVAYLTRHLFFTMLVMISEEPRSAQLALIQADHGLASTNEMDFVVFLLVFGSPHLD